MQPNTGSISGVNDSPGKVKVTNAWWCCIAALRECACADDSYAVSLRFHHATCTVPAPTPLGPIDKPVADVLASPFKFFAENVKMIDKLPKVIDIPW
jgi:hypothetical protein